MTNAPAFAAGGDHTSLESVSHYDREIQQSTRRLEEIRDALEKGRTKLKELQQEEGTYIKQIEQIEKNIVLSKTYLKMLSARIDTVENIIKKLNDSLVVTQRQLASRQAVMRRRLRQAYMNGPIHSWFYLFSAASPLDAINRIRYIEELNRYDRTLAERIESMRLAVDAQKKLEQNERNHLEGLRTAKEDEYRRLEGEEKQRKAMLADVKKRRESWEAAVRELEASQKELSEIIRVLEKKRKKAREAATRASIASFEKRKGLLPWPLEGKVTASFGKVVHPVYQTVVMNNGIDIEASAGDVVRCIAPGTVIHTGSMRGLGKIVIVDHVGGYMSIYAHLQSIDVRLDQKVHEESTIGRLGGLGSTDEAKLHFEIRRSTEALDPSDWLEKR